MKFTSLKTERVSLNGTHIVTFIQGHDYDLDEDAVIKLRGWGIAPSNDAPEHHHEKPKAAHPVHENKMAHPVEHNKLKLSTRS